MTKQEVIAKVEEFDAAQQIQWMLSLGRLLTISARSSYKTEHEPGRVESVMGHNEIQHRLFARIHDLQAGKEWTSSSFVEMLIEIANTYEIAGDVSWAVDKSLNHPD